jgi:hypothetical protein
MYLTFPFNRSIFEVVSYCDDYNHRELEGEFCGDVGFGSGRSEKGGQAIG